MKFLYLLSILVLCDGLPLQEAPNNVELSSFRNEKESGFVINWSGVDNRDEVDPILGFKVIIWEEEVGFAFEVKEDGTLDPKKTTVDIPVIIWEEEVGFAFEVKEDGTLDPKKTTVDIPSNAFDGKISVLFELKPNGQFVEMGQQDMLFQLWQKKIKYVYKLNSEGLLVPLTAADIPALELQHDSRTTVTELEVPANKTEVVFNGTKRNHIYEVAVQAYTSKSTGPLSKKTKIVTY